MNVRAESLAGEFAKTTTNPFEGPLMGPVSAWAEPGSLQALQFERQRQVAKSRDGDEFDMAVRMRDNYSYLKLLDGSISKASDIEKEIQLINSFRVKFSLYIKIKVPPGVSPIQNGQKMILYIEQNDEFKWKPYYFTFQHWADVLNKSGAVNPYSGKKISKNFAILGIAELQTAGGKRRKRTHKKRKSKRKTHRKRR